MDHHLDRSFTANSAAITPIAAAYSTIIAASTNLHLNSMVISALIANFFTPPSQTIAVMAF